jgi:FkbM family methyltransferase
MKNYLRILLTHEKPLSFVVARLLMATRLCRFLTIQQCGYRLWFHPANLSSQLWINPRAREEALIFFRAYLRHGDHVVDVGTNVGDTVITSALAVGETGSVLGIEAHPRTFSYLQENLKLNGLSNVTVIHTAVGASTGTVLFSDERRDDMNRVGEGTLSVRLERLDQLVPLDLAVKLLKVDVEGYEKFVFDGSPELLKRTECIFFEVSSLHFARFEYTTKDVLKLLQTSGFKLFRISSTNSISSISLEFESEHFENLLALRDESDFKARTNWSISSDS